jgi:hypothetical protein
MKLFRISEYTFGYLVWMICDLDSAVGIATLYGLDVKELEPGGSDIFPNRSDMPRDPTGLL